MSSIRYMDTISTWSLLVLTLPTENATARMRFWRALKSKGCAVLRDGIYLLPYTDEHEQTLRELADAIAESGGTAYLLRAPSLDASQEQEFRALFDRDDDYATFTRALTDARKTLARQSPTELTRLLRRLRKDFDAIRAIDYFPRDSATRAEVALQDFVALVDTVLSPGEPHAADRPVRPLAIDEYQGRTWATRQRMWVDRVASAWLIRRFIDAHARFIWLASPADCPADALGFDFDGATFTHAGERVTFEVLLASFGLDTDAALMRLGEIVHALDVGGPAAPEAVGFEAVMAGTRQRAENDDQLLEQMGAVLDSLYVHFTSNGKNETAARS
ncbi:chromate resistance exported protein [Burkholderia lata]|nr:chromate resistance exported protein [Burkholderia lata]